MARTCPACAAELLPSRLHGQEVDRCPDCRGVYFDAGELEAVVDLVRLFDDVELLEPEIDSANEREPSRDLSCPADGTAMEKLEVGGEVVDRCPECAGVWLDDGEVAALKLAEEHIRRYIDLYIRLGQ